MENTLTPYAKIALIEDDTALRQLIEQYLKRESFEVVSTDNGLSAAHLVQTETPDLVVLDIMLPGQDGLAVCRQIQQFYQGPILFLTARSETLDEILGLEIGADDYLTKPIEPRLLLARIKAHLRRHNASQVSGKPIDWLVVDQRNLRVQCQGRDISLTQPEFDLLALLYEKPGVIFSRDDVMLALRGIEHDGVSRTVDILVSGLRQKLGIEEAIKTVRGKGYVLIEKLRN